MKTVDSGATGAYAYDYQNRRIKRVVGSSSTHYVWEGTQVIAEHDASNGAVIYNYVYSGSRLIARMGSGVINWYLSDRSSKRLVLDANGGVIGRMAHLPFGEDFGENGTQEKHHFTSYERDGEGGTDYAVNRQYSQSIGRFSRPDGYGGSYDLGIPKTLNRYASVGDDPINAIDPLGLDYCFFAKQAYRAGDSTFVNYVLVCNSDFDVSNGPRYHGGDLISNLIKKLGQINDCEAKLAEKVFGRNYDVATLYAQELIHARTVAEDYEKQHGGPQDDNPVNARKHCIWSCEMSKHLNEESARKWGDAHECGSTSQSSNMDYHNNWIGRMLGNKAREEGKDCAELCDNATVTVGASPVMDGSLWALRP